MVRAVLFFVLLMCAVVRTEAQKSNTLTAYSMYQKTMIFNKEEYEYRDIIVNTPSYTPAYGIILSQKFNSRIGMEYGFVVSRQEQNFEIYSYKDAPSALENRKRVMYLKIPLLFRGDFLSRPNHILFFNVGPQVAAMMSEDGIIPIYSAKEKGVAGDTLYSFDIAEASGAYRRFTFDVVASLGWEFRLHKSIFLQVLCRADYSLTDVENKSFSTVYKSNTYADIYHIFSKDRPATHNISMGLGVGIAWKVR